MYETRFEGTEELVQVQKLAKVKPELWIMRWRLLNHSTVDLGLAVALFITILACESSFERICVLSFTRREIWGKHEVEIFAQFRFKFVEQQGHETEILRLHRGAHCQKKLTSLPFYDHPRSMEAINGGGNVE